MYGSERGKNFCGKTSAAATPYRKKSYHSIEVPIADAITARMSWRRWSAALSDGPDEAADKVENHRAACDRFTMVSLEILHPRARRVSGGRPACGAAAGVVDVSDAPRGHRGPEGCVPNLQDGSRAGPSRHRVELPGSLRRVKGSAGQMSHLPPRSRAGHRFADVDVPRSP